MRAKPRHSSTNESGPHWPQDSPTKLCLHGAVDSYGAKGGKGKAAPGLIGGKGKGKGKGPGNDDCYTWGNQEECSKPMSFVCKKEKSPCLTMGKIKPARHFQFRRF